MKGTDMRNAWKISLCALALLWLAPTMASAQLLASGEFALPASSGPGDPNFNFAFTVEPTVPTGLGTTAGKTLAISLRDSSRPDQFCDPDDPFGGLTEGCATIDWPFPGRRGINLMAIDLEGGKQTFHLRMEDMLSDQPEPDGP